MNQNHIIFGFVLVYAGGLGVKDENNLLAERKNIPLSGWGQRDAFAAALFDNLIVTFCGFGEQREFLEENNVFSVGGIAFRQNGSPADHVGSGVLDQRLQRP